MKTVELAIGAALLGALAGGVVQAQETAYTLDQPESVRQEGLSSYTLYSPTRVNEPTLAAPAPEGEAEPVDENEAEPLDEDGGEGVLDACCDDPCGSCSDPCGSCGDDPWTLPQPCVLKALGIKTGGWLQAGITLNGEDPGDNFNGPVLTNDRHADPQMEQFWLYFDRPCDTGGDGLDIGGRFDIFYGTDWRVAHAFGFGMEDEINGSDELYGLALPQMYAEVMWNKLSVKMGRMSGILGYEIIPPMGNFFYSHSYAICYSEPLLITGLMTKYPLTDQLNLQAGFHQGYRRFENNNDDYNFQGGVTWNSPESTLALAYALDTGRIDDAGLVNQYVHSLVAKLQLTENLQYVVQSDMGYLNGPVQAADAEWYGINQYMLYQLNEDWSAGMRIEWFRDDDGAAVYGLGNLPNARGWMGAPGYAGNFTALSFGLNWKAKPTVTIRPEIRWDWYGGPANPNGPYPLPFDNGTSDHQFTLAADLVWTF